MGIAARGIICTDYAYCDVCTYHLLARQDTDFVGMRIPNEAVGELVLQRRVQVYSPLGEIPVRTPPSTFVSKKLRLGTLDSFFSQRRTSLREKQLLTVFLSLSVQNPVWLDALGIFFAADLYQDKHTPRCQIDQKNGARHNTELICK